MAVDLTCMMSAVKNISGQEMFFPTLPPHGAKLAANEVYLVPGDIRQSIVEGDRFGSRFRNGLHDMLDGGYLQLLYTPSPILYDPVAEDSKMLILDSGSLQLADPCWETSLTVSQ